MELWVRSQDKTRLANIKQLYINEYEYKNTSEVYGQTTNDNHIQLGVYWPKERALKVLDEIQEYLINLDRAVIYSQTPFEDYSNVYEMPEK